MIKLFILIISLISLLATFINAADWLVEVGTGGQNVYTPNNFDANVGDTVFFKFVDGTHDVIQSDDFGSCVKSKAAGAFATQQYLGSPAASAPQENLTLGPKVGKVFYFCDVATHCTVGKMFAQINVLDVGAKLANPGVPATPTAPAGPPAQPSNGPADDQPNVQPPKASTSPSSSATSSSSSSPSSNPTTPPQISFANTNNQISTVSIAVMGGTALLFLLFL